MYIGTLIKALFFLIGLTLTIGLIVLGLVKNEKNWFRKSGIVFAVSIAILVIVSFVELLVVAIIRKT
jgi:hypothetical protein